MKTNTSDIGSKNWQEVDPRVLGQILAAQNLDFVLPDTIHIAEFYAETVSTVPGVDACRVCIDDVSVQKGEMNSEVCEACWATRKKAAGQDAASLFLSDTEFSCKLGKQPGIQLVALCSHHHHFGFFVFHVRDLVVFNIYSPFISNLINFVALSLENRLQRELLQKSRVALERKVEERTRDLEIANVQLQEEIEIKRQAEEALKREQMLLSRIMETSPVGITLVDLEGQITFANSQAEKVLGLTRDELIQRTYNAPDWHITTYNGDPFPNENLPFQRVISTGKPVYSVQHMIAWPDGHCLFLSINGAPILNEKGDIVNVVFTIEDITERKLAEESLVKSEQMLRTVFNTVEEALTLNELVFDENGEVTDYRILDANKAFEQITSLPNGQAIGKYATEFYGMSPEFIKAFWKEHLHDEHAIKMDMYIEQIQAWKHISTSIPVQNQFVISFFDITDLKSTESALRESERKFRSFVEESSEGFTLVDEQGRIIEWNRSRERMTGLKADQVIDRFLWDVIHQMMPPERRTAEIYEINRKIILDALETGQSSIFNHQIEPEVMSQGGERRFLRQTVFPIKTDKGFRIGSVTSDITERKHAEDALKEREHHSQSLLRLSRKLEYAQTYDDVLNAAQDEVRDIIGFQNLWAYLFTPDKKQAKVLRAKGPMSNMLLSEEGTATINIDGDRMLEEFLETKEIQVVEDAQTDKRTDKKIATKMGNHTLIHVPILLFDRLMGSVGMGTFGDEGVLVPTASEREYLMTLASHMAVTFDRIYQLDKRKQMEEELIKQEREFRTLAENSPDNIARYDAKCRTLYVNPTLEKTLSTTVSEMLGTTPVEAGLIAEARAYQEKIAEVLETGNQIEMDIVLPDRGEGFRYHNIRFVPERGVDGAITGVQAIGRDITERKQAEVERQAHLWFLESMDHVNRAIQGANDLEQMMSDVLDIALSIFNCDRVFLMYPLDPGASSWYSPMERTRPEYPGILALGTKEVPMDGEVARTFRILLDTDGPVKFGPGTPNALPTDVSGRFGFKSFMSMALHPKVGKPWQFGIHQCSYVRMWTPEEERLFQEIGRRLTDGLSSLLAYRNLQESEQRYRQLVDMSPDAIVVYSEGQIVFVNPATVRITGAKHEEDLVGKSIFDFIQAEDREYVEKSLVQVQKNGKSTPFVEEKIMRVDGTSLDVEVAAVPYRYQGEDYVQIVARDITERKKAEQDLRESEERLRQIASSLREVIWLRDVQTRQVLYVNPAFEEVTGRTCESFYKNRDIVINAIHPDDKEGVINALEQRFESLPFNKEHRIIHLDGSERWVASRIFPVRNEAGEVYRWASIMEDITERKQHEREREAVITVSTALRRATTRTEILSVILEQLLELFGANGAVLVLPDPRTGGFIDEMGRGPIGERIVGLNIPPGEGICSWVIENKKPYLSNRADRDELFYRPDLLGASHCLACVPLIAQEQAIGALWIARPVELFEQDLRLLNAIGDIAANAVHRVMLHEQTELQLRHLTALHQIDLAISANFDLNITFSVILSNVKEELEVDAVSILLLNPVTHTLDYAAGAGFRTSNIEKSHVRLGKGCAGLAAQECRTVFITDIRKSQESFSRVSFLENEEFVSHYDTPLIVKGQVRGVLEIFHRALIEPEPRWLSYFETLATQAAIAIENASLFENLQQSNLELMLAYDATIEGWSRALELRDRETEGHTQRVAEMALELAEKMGMSNAEKLDLRRGALLHDIGKMGIPDAILLKPGSLSNSEWEIMRQHPLYAYQMLSPIPYLKRALEIPYCHHEKWDGSGYPRGLKGDSIPLSARVFAVVDVFDALTSNRPYSKAWPLDKAYRYIQEQTGKHFDPEIAKIFLDGKLLDPQNTKGS
jgi:PAS domain S-box-containing protein/putative nucleotidyltransferase with HDIG domain